MNRLRAIGVVSAFYFGCLIYPVLRLAHWLAPDVHLGTPALLAIMVLPLLLRLTHSFFPSAFTRLLSAVSLTWLGVYFEAFVIVIVIEILRWVVPLADQTWGTVGITALIATALVSWLNTQRIKVRRSRASGT